MPLRVAEEAMKTDTGRQRTTNEDSYFARSPLFAVADGMGGAQAGEVASRMAAEAFEPAERGPEGAEAFLRSVVQSANNQIHALAQQDSSRSGMGTTLTAALVEGDEVSIGHVGDSRAYRFREGELTLLTSDHSLVEELRRQGRLTEEEAEVHPQRSIITRALGPELDVEVDTLTVSARPNDIYLICSDGLTTMVRDAKLAEILTESSSLDEAATWLVNEANEAGGRDNITVIAFRLEEGEAVSDDQGATLVGPTAAGAGLTAEAVRIEAARKRRASLGGAASGPGPRRREPEPSRKRRFPVKTLIALVVLAGIVAAGIFGARQVYFLGTDEGGRLSLYRGLPYDLPLGIELYTEVTSSPTRVASLPEDRRDEATGHDLRSREDAVDLLANLEDAAVEISEPAVVPGGGTGKANERGGSGNAGEDDKGGSPRDRKKDRAKRSGSG
ncbi:MAG: Stp1/IreP family PP2C-type Ser/Thr phosphatase [Actinomycetota bacterium]|nr:Stp1/IreP family PP2C-type Ser/Thr phosphatase [Actinomycetota bacterium]